MTYREAHELAGDVHDRAAINMLHALSGCREVVVGVDAHTWARARHLTSRPDGYFLALPLDYALRALSWPETRREGQSRLVARDGQIQREARRCTEWGCGLRGDEPGHYAKCPHAQRAVDAEEATLP